MLLATCLLTAALLSAALLAAVVSLSLRLRGARAALEAARASRDTWRAAATRDARLVDLGLGVAELAHELRAPLQRVVLGLDVAGLQGVPSRGLDDARRAVDRMTALCDRLVDHGRESGPLEADTTAALADALALLPRSDRGRVVADFAALPPVALGPLELSQVLHNLLRNALQHAPHAWVEARCSDDGVALSVHDDGPGIPAARREALFTPYVTGRAHAGGTGLGLPLVRRLVEEAGGTVTVAQGPRGGACFSLALPLLRCRHARAA